VVDLSLAETGDPWHLDKKVPIALIVTVLGGIGSGIWFAGTSMHRLDVLEREGAFNAQRMEANAQAAVVTRERLSRIEQMAADAQETLRRVDGKLDRLGERR
jgi:hypothetical protein